MTLPEPSRLPVNRARTPDRNASAPRHLSVSSRALWRSVMRDYELEPRHVALLTAGLEARDRAEEARKLVNRDGLVMEGRFGPKAHPMLAVERDSRRAYAQLQRELGLDLEAPPTSRPPTRWR